MVTATDRRRAERLAHHIRRFGVKVSIELQDGAGGSHSGHTDFRAIMGHHTASYPSQGPTPCLGIVKRGRGGAYPLPGPLANGYGGYDKVCRILTMGKANHPGAGGPFTVLGKTIPANNGRPYIFGYEFEGGYLQYDAGMRDFMARVNAGTVCWLAEEHGVDPLKYLEALLEHKTWAPGRKPDRIGYTREISIAETKAVLLKAGSTTTATSPALEEDEMYVLHAPDRADTVIGPGYFRVCPNSEQAAIANKYFKRLSVSTREHDVLKALAVQGKVTGIPSNLSGLIAASKVSTAELIAALTPAIENITIPEGSNPEAIAERVAELVAQLVSQGFSLDIEGTLTAAPEEES